MKKNEFRERIDALLGSDVDSLTWDEKLAIVRQRIVDAEKNRGFNQDNKGKTWTDEELRVVLRSAPTTENCMSLARAFRRGYGSVEQIFRWAAEDLSSIKDKDPTTLSLSKSNGLQRKLDGGLHEHTGIRKVRES